MFPNIGKLQYVLIYVAMPIIRHFSYSVIRLISLIAEQPAVVNNISIVSATYIIQQIKKVSPNEAQNIRRLQLTYPYYVRFEVHLLSLFISNELTDW